MKYGHWNISLSTNPNNWEECCWIIPISSLLGCWLFLLFPPLLLPTYLLLNFSKAWFTILAELSMEAHLDITDKSNIFQKRLDLYLQKCLDYPINCIYFSNSTFYFFFWPLATNSKRSSYVKNFTQILFLFSQALLTDDKHILFRRSSILE